MNTQYVAMSSLEARGTHITIEDVILKRFRELVDRVGVNEQRK